MSKSRSKKSNVKPCQQCRCILEDRCLCKGGLSHFFLISYIGSRYSKISNTNYWCWHSTVNSGFKKVHFSFRELFDFRKIYVVNLKTSCPKKKPYVLCSWICNLKSFLNREFTAVQKAMKAKNGKEVQLRLRHNVVKSYLKTNSWFWCRCSCGQVVMDFESEPKNRSNFWFQ